MLDKGAIDTLIGRLEALGRQGVLAIRRAVRKGQGTLEAGISTAAMRAPGRRVVNGHEIMPGGLSASIGSTMGRTRSDGSFDAKTGLAVGKSKADMDEQVRKGKKAVAYGHFGILGTVNRTTGFRTRRGKAGKVSARSTGRATYNRGRVQPHPFVVSGAAAVKSTVNNTVVTEIETQIAKHWRSTSE